jgi:hypothetical protein
MSKLRKRTKQPGRWGERKKGGGGGGERQEKEEKKTDEVKQFSACDQFEFGHRKTNTCPSHTVFHQGKHNQDPVHLMHA